jgi:aminopeptidase N
MTTPARRRARNRTVDTRGFAGDRQLKRWGMGCAAIDPQPGALGLGDSYYPGLGNGGYDVQHYDLELTVDPLSKQLDGVATVSAVATEDLCALSLDLWELEVRGVSVDGIETAFHREPGEVVLALSPPKAAGDALVIEVEYGGTPEGRPCVSVPFLQGVGWMTSDDSVHVIGQPMGANTTYPCNDHPTDKAFYDIHLNVPAGQVGVANGEHVGTDEHDDGTRSFHYRSAEPMASYLFTLAVGPFEVEHLDGPVPLTNVYHPAVADRGRAAFENAGDMVAHFSELFGPYPYSRYGGIASNLPMGAALETQTIPTYGMGATSEGTVAHELAHQWFGNSVSVSDFSDLWISEGFASYASWLWFERGNPEAYAARVNGTYRAVRANAIGPPTGLDAEQLFGMRLYGRGPLVLHALRDVCGDELFFAVLQVWTAKYEHGNASVADFEALVAEVAGAEAASVLGAWLHDETPPIIASLEKPVEGASSGGH